MENSFAKSLRDLRADARSSIRVREHLRFYAINRLDKNEATREDMLILRMIQRLDRKYPLGKHANVTLAALNVRVKPARDEQPVKGLEDPWKTRMEMLGGILPGSIISPIEPEMNIRRLRQLLNIWGVYLDFLDRLNDNYEKFRDEEKMKHAREMGRFDRLPMRLRRRCLEADLEL